MRQFKKLRFVQRTILEKDFERTTNLKEAELLLKIAAHMGPYAFQITPYPTYIAYEVKYELIPPAIKQPIATAMEILHRTVETRYKEVCKTQQEAMEAMKAEPKNKWNVEKFNSVNALRTFFEITLPSLKKRGKK